MQDLTLNPALNLRKGGLPVNTEARRNVLSSPFGVWWQKPCFCVINKLEETRISEPANLPRKSRKGSTSKERMVR